MSVSLPKGVIFSYSVPPDGTVTVEVTGTNPVDYCGPTAGAFGTPDGTIAPGESADFDGPGLLRSTDGSEVELIYPQAEPPAPENGQ